jgi:uncharacterized protein (TIGR04255 family)
VPEEGAVSSVSWIDNRPIPDVILDASPLTEVICQVRFPSVLRLQHDPALVAKIQDRLRGTYPNVEAGAVFQIAIPAELQQAPQIAVARTTWRVTDGDRKWAIAIAPEFVALSTSAYAHWDDFARRLEPVLGAVFEEAVIGSVSRIGLRYTNMISETNGQSWSHLIEPALLCWLADPGEERQIVSALQEVRLTTPTCRVGFRHGILPPSEGIASKYLIDTDCYVDVAADAIPGALLSMLATFNDTANRFFFNAVTPEALAGFGPRAKGGDVNAG